MGLARGQPHQKSVSKRTAKKSAAGTKAATRGSGSPDAGGNANKIPLRISADFASGNVVVDSIKLKARRRDTDIVEANLRIRDDSNLPTHSPSKAGFWFYFKAALDDDARVAGGGGEVIASFRLRVRGEAEPWQGYRVCYSRDDKHWSRLDATQNLVASAQRVCWKYTFPAALSEDAVRPAVWFAYYQPYTLSRYQAFIEQTEKLAVQNHGNVTIETIGSSEQGRPIHLLSLPLTTPTPLLPKFSAEHDLQRPHSITEPPAGVASAGSEGTEIVPLSPALSTYSGGSTTQSGDGCTSRRSLTAEQESPDTNIWIVARQHPGESIASWMVEGLARAWATKASPTAAGAGWHPRCPSASSRVVLRVIPLANPDGVELGNWYANSMGINMNGDWFRRRSKEVRVIEEAMLRKYPPHPLAPSLDLHGDESVRNGTHFVSFFGSPAPASRQQGNSESQRKAPAAVLRPGSATSSGISAASSCKNYRFGLGGEKEIGSPLAGALSPPGPPHAFSQSSSASSRTTAPCEAHGRSALYWTATSPAGATHLSSPFSRRAHYRDIYCAFLDHLVDLDADGERLPRWLPHPRKGEETKTKCDGCFDSRWQNALTIEGAMKHEGDCESEGIAVGQQLFVALDGVLGRIL